MKDQGPALLFDCAFRVPLFASIAVPCDNAAKGESVGRDRRAFRRARIFLVACLFVGLLACCTPPETMVPDLAAAQRGWSWPFSKLWVEDEFAQHPQLAEASRYELRLEISESLTTVAATLRVWFTNRQSEQLSELPFFCYPNLTSGALEVAAVTVAGSPVQPAVRGAGSLLVVPLPVPLRPRAGTEITIEYSLRVPEGAAGEANVFSYTQGVLSLAHAYPMIPAPRAWDHGPPAPYGDFVTNEVSFYVVRVGVPEDVVVAAPGVELARRSQGGRAEVLFAVGPARELYLAASRDFVVLEEQRGGTMVRSAALRGREEGAQLALEAAHAALESFSGRLGFYPFTTLTVVSAPLRALGMEFPGIIALASRLYDSEAGSDGLPQRVLLEGTLAHEIAHQWFYAGVGTDQLEEPWIDESLAQYAYWLYWRDRYGDGREAFQEFEDAWNAIGRAQIPVGMPVAAYSREEYAAIMYGRAPLFLHALAGRMGEERFDLLLSELTRRYEWQLIDG